MIVTLDNSAKIVTPGYGQFPNSWMESPLISNLMNSRLANLLPH